MPLVVFILSIPIHPLQLKNRFAKYITSNGVHTSFIIPYKEFNEFISTDDFTGYTNQKFVMIGWGDEDFYMNVPEWKDLTLKVALASTLLPTRLAMHVTLISKPHEDKNTKRIILSDMNYQLLVENIKNTFQLRKKILLFIKTKDIRIMIIFIEQKEAIMHSIRVIHGQAVCRKRLN